jgi:hypothetical protein
MIRSFPIVPAALVIASASATCVWGATLQVPSAFPTIQAAINASSDGDVIVIAPGTYSQPLSISGRSLTLRGSLTNPGSVIFTVPSANTILQVDESTVRIEGLTLRNGGGSVTPVCGVAEETLVGGAILTQNSTLTIQDSVLSDNTADVGGAIYLSGGSLTILRTQVRNNGNVATANGLPSSGSVLATCELSGTPTILIQDSVFTGNGDTFSDNPGGLNVVGAANATLTVRGSTFADNLGTVLAPQGATALTVEASEFRNNFGVRASVSSGLSTAGSSLSIDSSLFESNQGRSVADVEALVPSGGSSFSVTNSTFRNSDPVAISAGSADGGEVTINRCEIRGAVGSGILAQSDGSPVQISNTLVVESGEDGVFVGGASFSGETTISNTTIANNGGSGINANLLLFGALRVNNSIVSGNTGSQFAFPLPPFSNGVTVRYSIVDGGIAGAGNRDAAPGFVSNTTPGGDYRLVATSPAIDAGDNSLVLLPASGPALDLSGNPRRTDIASVSDTGAGASPIVDIGAYEFTLAGCPCTADFDGSGGTPDSTDIDVFFTAWLSGESAADADCSGGTPDSQDIDAFFTSWLNGGC